MQMEGVIRQKNLQTGKVGYIVFQRDAVFRNAVIILMILNCLIVDGGEQLTWNIHLPYVHIKKVHILKNA